MTNLRAMTMNKKMMIPKKVIKLWDTKDFCCILGLINRDLVQKDILYAMEHAEVWLYAKIIHFNNGAAPPFSILFNNRLCPSQYRYLIEKMTVKKYI